MKRTLLALVCAFSLFSGVVRADVEARMAQTGDPYGAMAKMVDEARIAVDVAIYGLNVEPGLVQALIRAADRGVRVRCILDPKNHKRRGSVAPRLEEAKIDIYISDRTQHEKFILIDDEACAVGSGNWTNSSIDREYEDNYILFEHNKGAIETFRSEWARLFAAATDLPGDGTRKTKADETVAPFDPKPTFPNTFEAYFTSLNDGRKTSVVADRIKEGIESAEESIHVMMAFLAHDKLSKALIKAHKEHNENDDPDDDLDIRVVLDQYQYYSSTSQAKALEDAGIPVRYKYYSLMHDPGRAATLHHKVMIVDGEDVFTGSYNWSETAEWKNYENLLVFEGEDYPEVTEAFEEEFERLYDLRRENFDPILKSLKAEKGEPGYVRYLPIHFDTPYYNESFSVTRKEMHDLNVELARTSLFRKRYNASRSYYDRARYKAVWEDDFAPEGTFLEKIKDSEGIVSKLKDE